MPKDGSPKRGIGASTKRREDIRFLTGKGRYTDDINLRGQAYALFRALGGGAWPDQRHRHHRRRGDAGRAGMMTGEDFAGMGGNPAAG